MAETPQESRVELAARLEVWAHRLDGLSATSDTTSIARTLREAASALRASTEGGSRVDPEDIRRLADPCFEHRFHGSCPDAVDPEKFDPECERCRVEQRVLSALQTCDESTEGAGEARCGGLIGVEVRAQTGDGPILGVIDSIDAEGAVIRSGAWCEKVDWGCLAYPAPDSPTEQGGDEAGEVEPLIALTDEANRDRSDSPEARCGKCGSREAIRDVLSCDECDPQPPREGSDPSRVEAADHNILGDAGHPQTRDYVATNLLRHIDSMPNSGDWWGQLHAWAEFNSTGDLLPNLPYEPAQDDQGSKQEQARVEWEPLSIREARRKIAEWEARDGNWKCDACGAKMLVNDDHSKWCPEGGKTMTWAGAAGAGGSG